jgi:hypothetical protein
MEVSWLACLLIRAAKPAVWRGKRISMKPKFMRREYTHG